MNNPVQATMQYLRQREYLVAGLLVLVALCILLSTRQLYQYRLFLDQPLSIGNQEQVFEVKPGATATQIGRSLKAQRILANAEWWNLLVRLSGKGHKIQAGHYLLQSGLTPEGLLNKFVKGEIQEHQITFIEGWNIRELLAAIAAKPNIRHTIKGLTGGELMTRLGLNGKHPEGLFFPDTYQYHEGTTDIELLRRAYQRMQAVLAREWENRDPGIPIKSRYEALILASIIEKETGAAYERSEISGVFTRRLEKNMKLQTDPTVIYGIGASFDGNLKRQDLRENTPYNTYYHKGLPPSPICMPGADAIRAAVQPKAGNSLYFVAKGDGSHKFSATLREHNNAVRKYQLRRKSRR